MSATMETEAAEPVDVYEVLKGTVMKMEPKNRFCSLCYDEYAVDVERITSSENENPPKYILIFMLRGIYGKWKQPICNIFWNRKGEGKQLGEIIKTVVRNVHRSGLTVIATISDHSKLNVSAIDYLMKKSKTKDYSYNVDYSLIYHIFDPCRLLKSFRNKLVDHDLMFEQHTRTKTASWKHIVQVYKLDRDRGGYHMLPKLSNFHIFPELIERRNTMRCAQVFSESVATEILLAIATDELEPQAKSTSDLLYFLDSLFDSCNGEIVKPIFPKVYRSAITVNSRHFEFWKEAQQIFDSMRFILPDNKVIRPTCLDMFPVSLNNMVNVFKALRKLKVKHVMTRCFNLDALSNLVQVIRALNNDEFQVICERTEGPILDQNILKLVMVDEYGFLEVE